MMYFRQYFDPSSHICCCRDRFDGFNPWIKFTDKEPEYKGTILVKRVVSNYEHNPKFYFFDAIEVKDFLFPLEWAWRDYEDKKYHTNVTFMRNDDVVHYEWMRLK